MAEETPVESTYSVVYLLSNKTWLVQGKGWSQIQLLHDPSDDTYRVVGWSVPDNAVVINVNITSQCKYKVKATDFHKLYDENHVTYGFGFYQREDAIAESAGFAMAVQMAIQGQRKSASHAPLPTSDATRFCPPADNQSAAAAATATPPRPPPRSTTTTTTTAAAAPQPPAATPKSQIKRGTVMQRIASFQHPSPTSSGASLHPSLPSTPAPPPPVPPPRKEEKVQWSVEVDHQQQQLQQAAAAAVVVNDSTDDYYDYEESVYYANPEEHNTNTQTAYDIYVNGIIPLGKMHILPRKVASSVSGAHSHPISDPNDVEHLVGVQYDPETRTYHGLPPDWEKHMQLQFGVRPSQLEAMVVDGYAEKIPNILVQMRNFLVYRSAFNVEGLFRIAPDTSTCNTVKELLNSNSFETTEDVHVIANLVKVWFRDLPTHVLDGIPRGMFTRCETDEEIMTIMDRITRELRSAFEWLLDLCCEVSMNSAVNKMHAKNLGIVIGPNLFAADDIATVNPMAAMEYSQSVAKFLTNAILHRARTVW